MTAFKLPFFSRGEISPRLLGRVDAAAYQSGLKTARNAIINVSGGVMNRPGTIMIGPTKYTDLYTRLIPFSFKTNDTHMLEFGEGYIRFIREDFYQTELQPKTISEIHYVDDGVEIVTATPHGYSEDDEIVASNVNTEINDGRYKVTVLSTTRIRLRSVWTDEDITYTDTTPVEGGATIDRIYEIASPYGYEDLPQLKYSQSADVLTLTHFNYPPKELRRSGLANWALVDIQFEPSTTPPTGLSVTSVATGSRTVKYQVTATDRTTNVESFPGIPAASFAITGATQTNPVTLTIAAPHTIQEEDQILVEGVVGMDDLNNRRFRAVAVTTNILTLQDEDGGNYDAFVASGTPLIRPTFYRVDDANSTDIHSTITWEAVEGATVYSVYREENGLYCFIGETEKTTFTDQGLEGDAQENPPASRNPFRTAGQYPGAVGFHQQRRLFGGSLNAPATWEASQPGDYANFGRHSPIKDDDAITYTLSSGQINQIKHFVAGQGVGILTSGAEWTASSGEDVAFSPYTVKTVPNTNWGVSDHSPILMGKTVVFVQEDNRTVRSFRPSRSIAESDTSEQLTIGADHLFELHGVKDWALARAPYSSVIMTRDDGQVVVMTRDEDQEVLGWTRWDTKGTFETVGVIRICVEHGTPEPDDGVYFVVKRKLNGHNVQIVERLKNRRLKDVRDAFFVDCGRSIDRPLRITDIDFRDYEAGILVTCNNHGLAEDEVITFTDITWEPEVDSMGNETQPDQLNDRQYIVFSVTEDTFTFKELSSGDNVIQADATWKDYVRGGAVRKNTNVVYNLDWLEGETVSVLADSFPIMGMVVENGTITLPGLASRIHVGLPYTCDIQTLSIEPAQMGTRTIQGKRKNIPTIVARLDKSREAWFGPTNTNLVPMKRAPYVDVSPALFSGDRELTMPGDWNGEGGIFFRVMEPLPFTLLAVFPEVMIGNAS